MEPVNLESFNKNREFLGYKDPSSSTFQKLSFTNKARRKLSLASPTANNLKSKCKRKMSGRVSSPYNGGFDSQSQLSIVSKAPTLSSISIEEEKPNYEGKICQKSENSNEGIQRVCNSSQD